MADNVFLCLTVSITKVHRNYWMMWELLEDIGFNIQFADFNLTQIFLEEKYYCHLTKPISIVKVKTTIEILLLKKSKI